MKTNNVKKTHFSINVKKLAKPAALCFTALFILSILSVFATASVRATTPTLSTFGRTDTGNFQNLMSANKKGASEFVAGTTGNLTKISAYVKFATTAGFIRAALYADNAGSPSALIAVSNQVSLPSTFSWVDFPFSSTPLVNSGTKYWLALLRQTDTFIMADNTVSNNKWNANPYANGFSAPFGSASTNSVELCIYGTIQVSSQSPTPTPTLNPGGTAIPSSTAMPTPTPTPKPTATPTPNAKNLAAINDGAWYTDATWQNCPALNIYRDTSTTYQGNPTWRVVPGNQLGVDHNPIGKINSSDHIIIKVWVKTSGTPEGASGSSGAHVGFDVWCYIGNTLTRICGINSNDAAAAGKDYPNAAWPDFPTQSVVPFGTSTWTLITYDFTVPKTYTGDGGVGSSSGLSCQIPLGHAQSGPFLLAPWCEVYSNWGSTANTYTSWFSDFQFYINP